jgi:hypothetical protein
MKKTFDKNNHYRLQMCIAETAVVAAGFKYRRIGGASDCAACFSRPVVAYVIRLNDSMPDDLREKLLVPFIGELEGQHTYCSNFWGMGMLSPYLPIIGVRVPRSR